MDQRHLIPAPFFDGKELRERLTALWSEYQSQDSKLRSKALDLLKQVVENAHADG